MQFGCFPARVEFARFTVPHAHSGAAPMTLKKPWSSARCQKPAAASPSESTCRDGVAVVSRADSPPSVTPRLARVVRSENLGAGLAGRTGPKVPKAATSLISNLNELGLLALLRRPSAG